MKGNCDICGKEIEITMCCSGRDCGCLGLPVEPPICEKKKCYEAFILRQNKAKRRIEDETKTKNQPA